MGFIKRGLPGALCAPGKRQANQLTQKTMTLFTGKGDDGTTKTFGCDQRISKSSSVAEALGSLDEINSFLGFVKVRSDGMSGLVGDFEILGKSFAEIINDVQQNLFIIQAEVAGSKMTISEEKLRECENYVNAAEKILPPIKTFFVSGGTELASLFDISRTLARKAERRVVAAFDGLEFGKISLAYLNRLSSLLYAMSRLSNHIFGVAEDAPSYK